MAWTGTLSPREEKGPPKGAQQPSSPSASQTRCAPGPWQRSAMRSPPPRAHFLLHPVFAEAKSPAPVRLSCPDSVRPLGSSQSRCDSLEASGRDPNPRAARSPPQRCPLLAQARRSLLPPGAGSQAPASRRPRWPTVRKPAVAHVLSLRLDGDPGMSEVTGQTSACRGPGARAARGEAGFAKAGPPGEGAPRQEPEDNNSSWEGPVPCPPPLASTPRRRPGQPAGFLQLIRFR